MTFRFNNEVIECSVATARVIRSIAWDCYVESSKRPKVDTNAYLLFNAINDALRGVGR